jgi:putative SOS response-associated peptidase YedK
MALRELPTTTFTMIAKTPQKKYSPTHDKASRILERRTETQTLPRLFP